MAVFSAFSIVFGIFDLQISKSIYNADVLWVNLYQKYGQIPGMVIGFSSASLLLRLSKTGSSHKIVNFRGLLFVIALSFAVSIFINVHGQKIILDVGFLLAPVTSIICLAGVQIWLWRFSDKTMQKFKFIAEVSLLLVIIAGVATVWAFKIPWGRWTFRDMIKAGELILYTPWYLPQGFNGHYSFISGHTGMAFCVLPIVLLFRKNSIHSYIAWILVLLWSFSVALSRVIIGAHFASDVLFAAGQTLFWFFILQKLRYKPN